MLASWPLGCGPGTDLATLANAVGPGGKVIGIDHDSAMVEQAKRRLTECGNVEVRIGDAHELPLPDASVDRTRVDRVLQHLEDPARAMAELRRVIRPGGKVAMAEPDWDTLAIDDIDVNICRAFTGFISGRVRNSVIGRQLARLALAAGFSATTVEATAVVFLDFEEAEQILGLRRNAVRAVQAGSLPETVARQWLQSLEAGPFLAGFTFYTVIAQT